MINEIGQSLNAIPPRRSSSGQSHHNHHEQGTKPTLKPVPESSWLASSSIDGGPREAEHRSRNSVAQSLSASIHNDFRQTHSKNTSEESRNNIESIANAAIHSNTTTWSEAKEKILMGPYDYMFDHPGKDIRKQLIAAFNVWLKVPSPSLNIITKVIGMLHTASLLVDDVEDFSQLRRGVPVAHSIFGTAQTINSANYVYFAALQELLKLGNDRCIRIYTNELCNLHRGQGMDLYWRDTLTCPTEQDYLEMVGNKTGGLFRLAVMLMHAESSLNQDHAYIPLVNTIGLLFQIRDDYMNLASSEYTETKGLCEDLTEGKFSFPIIHSIRSDPSNLQLLNILKQKTTDDEVKKYAVKCMERTGSFDYCKRTLALLNTKALEMLHVMDGGQGEGDAIRRILDRLIV